MSFNQNSFEMNYEIAKEFIIQMQVASVNLIQRRLRVGFRTAVIIMDKLEDEGIVGPYIQGKPRTVLIKK